MQVQGRHGNGGQRVGALVNQVRPRVWTSWWYHWGGDSDGEHCRAFVHDWGSNGAKVGSATGVSDSGVERTVVTLWGAVGWRT
jgi:hypothetical protein